MTASAVHQFVPSFVPRDAIGGHVLQVRSVLEEMGLRSDLYVDDADPSVRDMTRPFDSYRPRGGEWLLYQASTGSRVADWLLGRPEPQLLNYHNVTPASLLERWDPRLADEVAQGRRQIAKLASVVHHAIAVSRFNEEELIEDGFRSTAVVPLLFDVDSFDREVDRTTADWLSRLRDRGGASLLFVGRIVPNKAQHDVIKALYAYRRAYDPDARLHLVGVPSSPAYIEALKRYVGALGLREAVEFAGSVSQAQLSAYYRGCDAFVCLSDHEGFGAPLLEAMYNGLPVVAYRSSVIPETLEGTGLLLDSKEPSLVAAATARVLGDAGLRRTMVENGRRRLADFALPRTRAAFAASVRRALEAG